MMMGEAATGQTLGTLLRMRESAFRQWGAVPEEILYDRMKTVWTGIDERGSIILTSNKSYGEWGSIFGDPIIATAILDRLLHHPTTINIRGESYRLKERRKAGLIPLQDQQKDQLPNSTSSRGKRSSI
jgi:hypothetical protein